MMLEVQKFLNSYPKETGLKELENQFAIKVRDYPNHGIVMLNYHMLDSPKTHPITIECRSLILNRENYEVVSRKFDRFFNLGENPEFYIDFDFKNCHILSKEDGSLIGVYYNPIIKNYSLSTRSLANAEMEHLLGGTWYNRILSSFGFYNECQFQRLWGSIPDSKNWTFIFEMIGPENRIVTPYAKSEMVFIGATSVSGQWMTWKEMTAIMEYFDPLEVRLPEIYVTPNSINELIDHVSTLPDLKEGFVIWDSTTNKRQKIKSKAYMAAHAIRGENTLPTRKNIFSLIFSGEADEFLVYFPEYKELFDTAKNEIEDIEKSLIKNWDKVFKIEDQKEFALIAKDLPQSFILFMAKKQKKNPIQVFHELAVDKKVSLLLGT